MATPTPVLKASCTLPERGVFSGRIQLLPHGLLLTGWRLAGRFRRHIDLEEILSVGWRSALPFMPNLWLVLRDGEQLELRVKSPGIWKYALEERLAEKQPAERKLYLHRPS